MDAPQGATRNGSSTLTKNPCKKGGKERGWSHRNYNLFRPVAGSVNWAFCLKPFPVGVVSRASLPLECFWGKRLYIYRLKVRSFPAIIVSFLRTFSLGPPFMLQATPPCRTICRSSDALIKLPYRSDPSLSQNMHSNQQSRNEMLSRMLQTTQSLRQLSFTSGPEQVQFVIVIHFPPLRVFYRQR